MKKIRLVRFALPAILPFLVLGCIQTKSEVEVKPIEVEVKPMQISIDLNVKVDKALDQALDQAQKPAAVAPDSEKGRIYASMRASRNQVNALRDAGKVGEGRNGLLAIRVEDSELNTAEKLLVAQTNADRERLYGIIAGEQHTTPAFVAERRNARARERAKTGAWLQDTDGNWSRKP